MFTVKQIVGENASGEMMRQWNCKNALQAEKHLPTWKNLISPGDVTEIQDAAAEEKQARGTGARRPSKTFVYQNGEAVETASLASTVVAPKDNPVIASLARRILDFVA